MGGDSRRPPGPGAGVGAGRPQPGGDGPPRRHGRHAPVRRRDGHRGQDAGAGGVQTVARPRGGAQPPGVGGPGSLLHPGDLRGAAGRGDRRDGHRQPRLGLRGGAGGAGREGPGTGLRMARRACRPPCPARAGPRRAARPGLLRHGLAVQVLPLPQRLPAGRCSGSRGRRGTGLGRRAGGAGDRRGGAQGAPRLRGAAGHDPGVRGREAVGGGEAPGLAGAAGSGQSQARRTGEDPLRGHGSAPLATRWTTGGSTTCSPRTSAPRSSPRTSPSTCGSARRSPAGAHTGPLPLYRGTAPLSFNRARQGPRHTMQEEPQWHAPSTR